jgi:hypothetical protein
MNYSTLIVIFLITSWFYKPIRFYILSFFFDFFNNNEYVGKLFGIQYYDDFELVAPRNTSQIYMTGVFPMFFKWFTGMPLELEHDVMKNFKLIQADAAKKLNLEPYIQKLDKEKLTVTEFEDIMSIALLEESNRVFNILPEQKLEELKVHLRLFRNIIGNLTNNSNKNVFKDLSTNYKIICKLSNILKSVKKDVRLFLFVPQLTLLNSFTQMIIDKNGDLAETEIHEFLKPVSKYMTMIYKGNLTIVRRHLDKRNSFENFAFGVNQFKCPGRKYTYQIIQSVLDTLKKMNVKIDGNKPEYHESKRFRNIKNKDEIIFTINFAK